MMLTFAPTLNRPARSHHFVKRSNVNIQGNLRGGSSGINSASQTNVKTKASTVDLAKTDDGSTIPGVTELTPEVGLCAWRGDIPTQSSLPLLPNGRPDYSKVDASPISKVLNRTVRKLLVEEVGEDTDPRPWTSFDGMLTSVRQVNDGPGDAKDVQDRAERVFSKLLPALGIGFLTPIWKKAMQPVFPAWATNFAFVLVFKTLFPWLMGPMKGVDPVDVEVSPLLKKVFPKLPDFVFLPQAVKAERCRFVESTSCASVCVNTCKVPSQRWLYKDFGMKVHIQPNYDDFSCQWKFNVQPPPLEEDEAVMVPCFAGCDSEVKGEKDAFRQKARALKGFGMEGGVDKYTVAEADARGELRTTGDTLEQIVARASEQAKADAMYGITPDGTALTVDTLSQRVEESKSSGKCWSVGDTRSEDLEKLLKDKKA